MSIGEKYFIIGLCSGQAFYYDVPKYSIFADQAAKPVIYKDKEYHLLEVEKEDDDSVYVALKDTKTRKKMSYSLRMYKLTKSGQLGRQMYNTELINAVFKALGRKRVRSIKEEWPEFFCKH